ncbi:MAG TPA: TetR/AcrR family transcriptional regulator [Caulobacteraceae bacterium]|nr:TetR/AcrR family transcriptional regulator [Caulobacteraceae bacterium]
MPRPLSDEDIEKFRERLIDAAERLFAEHGPEAVTMRQLADTVGVSPMTPYRYFKDKEEILAAARARGYERFAQTLEAAHARGRTRAEQAELMGEAYVRFALQHPNAYRLIFDTRQPNEADYPELARAGERARRTMTLYVEPPPGAQGEGADRELIGRVYWAALHGPIMLQLAGKLEAPYDAVRVISALTRALWTSLPAAAEPALAPAPAT